MALLKTVQHRNTPDNTVDTYFDFSEENYKRVSKLGLKKAPYLGGGGVLCPPLAFAEQPP